MVYDFNSLTKQADEASNRDGFYTDFGDVDPNKLHQISELTDWVRTKAKGSDVREVIAQLFERTWLENIKEGNANMEVAQARGSHPNLRSRLDEADSKQRQNTAQLAQKANKDEVTNVMTPKGTLAYASLPTSGNQAGWYYYCPDGDGTHGAGNYVWNGKSWFFGGTGDEGYNLLKKDLSHYEKYENVEKSYYEGILCKNGSIENRSDWSVSYPIDLNGIKCVRVKGIFNNLKASDKYTHIVFYNMPDVSQDRFVSYISLAETEAKEIDILIDVPKGANYMCICNGSINYNNISIDVYYDEQYMKDNRRHNIVSDFMELNDAENEITMCYKNGNLIFNGSSDSNTTFLVYSSMNGFLLENGETYIVDFIPENSTEKAYIQIFANNTSIPLVNGMCYNSYSFTVPNDAEDVFVRFILFSGDYINETYKFSIRKKNNEYSKLYISNASELYDFLKNPIPYTHLILESTTYDIYTGLFENDIANNEQFKHENFLHDVIIDGNNSTISFLIPPTVLKEKPVICNTYSCINVKGNITVNDVTLIGKNCRYTLHEESLDEFLWFNTKHKYNNCTIIYEGYDFNTVNANTIGCGFSKNQNIEFNECDIVNNTEHAGAFYVHTRSFNISNLSFNKCTFNLRDNAFSIVFSQYTGNGKKCPVHINNSIIGKVEFITQNNGLRNNQWSLKAINSFITQLYVDNSTTLLFKPKKVNTIDGTIE